MIRKTRKDLFTGANIDRKRTEATKVTTAAEDGHSIIESKRNKMKTTPELTAELNSYQQQAVSTRNCENLASINGAQGVHSHQEIPVLEGEYTAENTVMDQKA